MTEHGASSLVHLDGGKVLMPSIRDSFLRSPVVAALGSLMLLPSCRSATGPMATWLRNDLASVARDWIIAFFHQYPLEGYRRLAFMMLDRDIVAVSPSSVYRVLKAAGLLADRWQKPTRKGLGFVQPLAPPSSIGRGITSPTALGTFRSEFSISTRNKESSSSWC